MAEKYDWFDEFAREGNTLPAQKPANLTPPTPRVKPLSPTELRSDEVSTAINRGLQGSAAEAAQRKTLAKELSTEPELITDVNAARTEALRKKSNLDSLAERDPELANFLLAHPINSELAADDVPVLRKIAQAWRRTALDPIVQVFGKGSLAVAKAGVGAADLATRYLPGKEMDFGKMLADAGVDLKELDKQVEGLLSPEQQLANRKLGEQKTFTGALEAIVENPSSATDMVLSSLLSMYGGALIGRGLLKAAPAAGVAVTTAVGEGVVIGGGLQEKIRQDSETGTTTEAQKSIATLAGTIGGGLSTVSNLIARRLNIPDVDSYIAAGSLKGALAASKTPPSVAKVILGGAVTEGVLEEMPQSVIEQFAENVALGKQWDDGLGAAAAQGLVAGSLTQLGFSPMMIRDAQNTIEDNISRERHKAASDVLQKTFKAMRAEGTRDMLAKVGDAVSESNLRNLSTDAFAEFVDHMTEDSDVDAVYVPVEKLDEVLLQSGMTESELTDKMPEVADNIRIARATKGDVRIPVKDYLVNFAGTPTEKSLLDHLKIDPEGMTFAESQEFMQSQKTEFEAQAQQIIAADQPVLSAEEYAKQPVEGKTYKQYLQEHPDQNAVIEADSKNVERVIVGELNKAGRFNREANAVYAVPFREFFRTAAIRETRSTGKLVTPTEIYERYPLKYQMRGETPTATPDTLTQPVTAATPEDFKTENIQDILKNGNWMIVAATNPNASTLTDAENEKLHEKLIADLEARGLKHEVVYGRYPGDEAEMPSVLVYDVDNATARDFANRYDQDSVLVRDGFIYRDGRVKPHLGNVTTYSDTASAFSAGGYTRVPSTGAIFSVDFDWDANDRYTPGADFYAQPTIQKPGSMTLVGVHYSHEKRTVLDGTKYGTGLTGKERDRVLYGANTDDNIKTRVDFYTDTGNGVTPESGLGGVKHEVLLTDIYDASINPLNLSYPPTWDGGNTFEQQVLANGFKGYFVNQGKQGRVVLLGEAARAVPVPTPEQLEEQKYEQRRGSGFPSAETRAYQGTREADGSLKGLPRQVGGFNAAHYRKAEEVTRKYMADAGLPYNPPSQYVTVDPERAKRIASAFDAMKHDPQDPLVKDAYAALAAETIAQYKAVLDSGLVIEFIDFSKTGDPYEGNPRKMTEDVINNNHMWVFSTREGFGSDAAFDPTDNPLLAETEFEISGQKALVNDLFRVVHDYFGHVKEGVGFRASGEENAWRAHMSMFSPLAGRALTTETRGQNSWVNFGPYAEHNKTASGADTHYADQKIGLLPEWVSADGVNDSVGAEGYQQSSFYSALEREIGGLNKIANKEGAVKPDQAIKWIEARQKEGKFKKEEVEAVGILDWLQTRTGDVKVAAVEDFVRQNGVQLEVMVLGDNPVDEDRVYDIARENFFDDFEAYEHPVYESLLNDAIFNTAREMLDDPEHPVWELYGENWHDTEDLESYSRDDVSELARRLRGSLSDYEIIGEDVESDITDEAYTLIWERESDHYLEKARRFLQDEEGGYPTEFEDYQLDGGENYREILFRLPHLDLRRGFDAPHFRGELAENLIAHTRVNERVAKTYTPEEQAQLDEFKKQYAEWAAGNNTQEIRSLISEYDNSMAVARKLAGDELITEERREREPKLDAALRRSDALHAELKALRAERRAAEPKRPVIDAKEERVLFVEEVQSDWAQQGRDFGFILKNPPKLTAEELEYEAIIARINSSENSDKNRLAGKPPTKEEQERLEELRARNVDKSYKKKTKPDIKAAPFVTDTQAWVTLVTKRLLRYAAENGFTRISWTTGAQQADRYRGALLAQVDEVLYSKNKYGTYSFELYKNGNPSNQRIWEDNVSADRIMAVFGKDIGEKIVNGPVTEGDNKNVIPADDLTVGGSGMKDFYDKLLPSVVSKVTKSLGGTGRVELIDFTGKGEVSDTEIGLQQSIAITPEMTERIMSGLPLFKGERGSFNPNTFITTLTDGSDKSTVIHEGGHFYLEALADMAAQPDAPQQVKDDFRKTLDWFGIKGGEQQPSVVGTTPELEQKAFHGSPHTFDRFSTSAIGSGEGAQAYGYGLYFADNKGVAEYYKETLADSTNGPPRRFFKGELLEPYSPRYHAGTILSRKDIRTLKQARAEVRSWIEKGEKDPRLAKEVAGWQETLALLNEASSKKDFTEEPYKGRLYEVELAPEQDDYLLWDEPLSKQSEKVKAAVEKLHTTASERPSARSLKKILEGNPKGEDIYRALKNEFQHTERNDVEASKRLHELGIRGVKYLDGTSRSKGEGSYNYVVFSDDDVEITAFYQGKETPQPGELPKLSTPEEVWAAMTLEQKRPFHEQWAQSFERYILEGKAPTVEMQPVFARFRAWMISVYKSIKEFLKQNPLAGKLNDDVRAVFDRLLATEEKIAEMERARSMMPLFASADQAGVTQAKFEAYLAEGQAATDEAVSQLAARSLRDMKWASGARDKALRQLQREAKAKRRALTEEVAAEVAQEPITQARNFLLRGIITGDDGVKTKASTTFKLDRGAINELYPGIDLTRIEKMVSDAGMTPDAAAQMFGFSSGQELVDALLNEESTTDKIQGLVDQRMLERYGDLVDDKAIEAAADKAIHNRVRAKFLATGLAMLKGQPGTAKDLNKAARLAAEGALSAKKVRDITPGQYAAAERRANAEALKRVKENPASAIEAQRAALLNNHMARIARDIREEVEAGLRYVKKFDKKELRKLLGPDYVEQIDDLLSGFDFRKGTSLAQIDKMQSLRDWIEDQEAEGLDPAIDLDLVEALKTKSYKEMTIEEFRSLIDAVKQIEHLGRLKNKLLTARDQKEFRATVDEAEQSIRDNANRIVTERETPSDVFGKVGKWVRQMFASHRKFNSVIREMDGFKNAGVMWRILARPMNAAGDREVEMRQQAAEQIAKLFGMLEKKDTVPGNLYSKKRLVPGTNISMTQEQRIMFGMNWGNEGNRQRLMDGGLTGRKALSAQEAYAILGTITKEEWDFIQGVLDYIGSYKDQIAALEKQLTGIEPKWIEASPIVTKFGTYRGGYFPAKYDADLSTRSEVLEAVNDLRMGMKGAFGSAATKNGYTKERSKQVIGRPILLSFNVISQHVSEVTHRLAWQPWLIDANRLLRALDEPIREHYGTEILRELRNTVLDIATGDVGAKNAMEAAINHLRTGSTIVGMGWRVTTALLQPSGLAQSWTRLGSRWATAGVARYLKNPLEAGRFVDEKSSLMRNRGITMQREINEVLNTLRSGDKVSAVTGSYFTMIGKMQRTVDIPTWLGAYEKHLYERGYEAAEGEEERNRMENEAIAIADQTVIDTQSGGQIKDLASIQRGSPVQKLFTNFYSYFSATYNLNVETVRRTDFRDPASVGLMAVDLLLLNAAPVLFAVALKNMMKGGCDWGDTECLVDKVAQEQVSFLMGQMVVLREVAVAGQAVIGGDAYGYQGPAGLRFFSDLYKLGTQVEQGDADFAAFKAANSVAGALFHYPAGQINSTLDGILAIEDGRVEGVSILPALIAGAPKE